MSSNINRRGIRSQKAIIRTGSLSGASALTLAVLAILHGAPARAADAAVEDTGALTEIVVTAEKRSENLEVVPASITAFNSKMLDQQGIASVQDLTNYAPGLYYTTYDNRPYIRGIGRNTDNLAVESGVAVYVDGIYNGANASTILQSSTLFVDQIQVLRGPQNTLFGRNADGGMIDYISKRPTSDFQGEVRTGYDNYHKAFVEGAFSGPINDSVRYRFGANYTNQNGKGFYTNLNGVDEGGDVAAVTAPAITSRASSKATSVRHSSGGPSSPPATTTSAITLKRCWDLWIRGSSPSLCFPTPISARAPCPGAPAAWVAQAARTPSSAC